MSNTPPFSVQAFFETLPVDREQAFTLLQTQVPINGDPSPRVQAYVESGEWDDGPQVPIRLLLGDACRGRVGTTNMRFCGVRLSDCSFKSHETSFWPGFQPGWYIPGGTSPRAGYYKEPWLPPIDAGGPILQCAALELQRTGDPVLLTVGQWRFLFNEWTHSQVELSSQSQVSRSSESVPGSVLVDLTRNSRHQEDQPSQLGVQENTHARITRLEALLTQYAKKLADIETVNTRLSQQLEIAALQLRVDPMEVNNLKMEVNRIKNVVSVGGGVKAHSVRFSHPNEIKAWLLPLNNDVSIFHDAVSILHCIGATTATHKSTLAMMKAPRDVKFASDMEARVITSFRTNLPSILYGGSTASDPSDDYIQLSSKLKSYKTWHDDDGVSGVSQRMLRGAAEVLSRVNFLASQSTTDPDILRLSNGLLIDSINFINRLVSFIDGWTMDLKMGSYFSEAQVWEIMVATIEQIFEDLRIARSPIQDASESERSILLWGILKSHEVMGRYLKNQFKNDPSLNGILIQKMLRGSPTAITQSSVSAIQRNVTTVTNTANNLKMRVQALETKTSGMPSHP